MLRRPLYLFLFGLLVIFGGFFYDLIFAGIPYPDPDPAMAARYEWNSAVAEAIYFVGGLLVLSSAIVWAVIHVSKESPRIKKP